MCADPSVTFIGRAWDEELLSIHLPEWRVGRCFICSFFSKQFLFRQLQLKDLQTTAGSLMLPYPPLQSETQAEMELVELEGGAMSWAP